MEPEREHYREYDRSKYTESMLLKLNTNERRAFNDAVSDAMKAGKRQGAALAVSCCWTKAHESGHKTCSILLKNLDVEKILDGTA